MLCKDTVWVGRAQLVGAGGEGQRFSYFSRKSVL